MNGFPDTLKKMRESRSMSQGEVADFVGVKRPLVSMWENGKAKPSVNALQALQKLFGTNFFNALEKQNVPIEVPIGTSQIEASVPIYTAFKDGVFVTDKSVKSQARTKDSGNLFGYILKGDSMAPLFRAGDVIIVDKSAQPQDRDYVLVSFGKADPVLREYRSRGFTLDGLAVFDAIPANPVYPTTTASKDNQPVIHGVVLEHRRFFRNG